MNPISIYLSKAVTIFIVFCCINVAISQPVSLISKQVKLSWAPDKILLDSLGNTFEFDNFKGAIVNFDDHFIPKYIESVALPYECEYEVLISDEIYIPATRIPAYEVGQMIETKKETVFQRGHTFAAVTIIPVRKNIESGTYELLSSFTIEVQPGKKIQRPERRSTQKINSVLATGKWYKISISESGVYKMDYDYLKQLGMDVDNLDPGDIRIYGNGGGMLPQANSAYRPEDLLENAIYVEGESDHSFDPGDYVLFYGQGPHKWNYDENSGTYSHVLNEYSERAYYFITVSKGKGQRIGVQHNLSDNPDYTTDEYDCLVFHEKTLRTDVTDYVKSGRDWFGETFNLTTLYSFNVTLPGVIPTEDAQLVSYVAARSDFGKDNNFFTISTGNQTFSQGIDKVDVSYYLGDYCRISKKKYNFNPQADNVTISYTYSKPSGLSVGWLNYFEIIARCKLKFTSGQLIFRDAKSLQNNIVEYQLNSALGDVNIWDITYDHKVLAQQYSSAGSILSFRVNADTLRQFIAFTPASAKKPKAVGELANQDLHGVDPVDMVIIAYPDYLDAANQLADFHKKRDSLRILVTTPALIYNEFSSGAQDITAIRDFMRYLYKSAQNPLEKPEYLLLFGDASYDYKDVLQGNTNFVPTYQSPYIYSPERSYASDDYYGFLDDNEGDWDNSIATQNHRIDLQIGRFPVHTKAQAQAMVDKVKAYVSKQSFGDWRTRITFVADDGDDDGYNDHIRQTESLAVYIEDNYQDLNLVKIYLDAFQQVSSPNGNKYPDAQAAITANVEGGSLVVNYTGHGGEAGWAHERVLEIPDINAWNNMDNLPLFVTATCEFSRYDDPARVSAGELVLLNPHGGAIAMLTTSRVVYVAANNQLTNNLYLSNIFEQPGGLSKTFGEINVETKDKTTYHPNTRKFILLGDPALRLVYPQYEVATVSVPDTFKALSSVTIKGEIRDNDGNKMSGFNGVVYPAIFDKKTLTSTLANDPLTKKVQFYTQNNILYKGKATVKNGEFSFSFIVPKDISYVEGRGKITYYATNDVVDAKGYYDKFIVGGTDENIVPDNTSPELSLYMGDTNFVYGGKVDENPLMIARVFDENGINTTGNGIGHELIAILDDGDPVILNNYYESRLNDYTHGVINYPFKGLAEGIHHLTVKVWDVANNSATATTVFEVVNSENPFIEELINYPNPFSSQTTFRFKHNLSGQNVELSLQVYNTNGSLVYLQNENVYLEGNTFLGFRWNGRSSFHKKLDPGVYFYRVNLTTENETLVSKTSRLLIIP